MEPNEFILKTATEAGLTTDDILSARRSKHLVQIRSEIIKELNAAGISSVKIGAFLNRNHSTVLHHLHKDPSFYKSVSSPLTRKCTGCDADVYKNTDGYEIGHGFDCPIQNIRS